MHSNKNEQIKPSIGNKILKNDQKAKNNNNNKTSMQTQTNNLVDSGVQTSLDSIDLHKRRNTKEPFNDMSTENESERIEVPTRDNFNHARLREKSNEKRKIFSSSPKRTVTYQISSSESITSESSKSGNKSVGISVVNGSGVVNSSTDLTRISTASDHFIATGPLPGYRVTHPRVSRSPVTFNRQQKQVQSTSKKETSTEKQSMASTLTSTVVSSSLCSTITNVTLPQNSISKNSSLAFMQSSECDNFNKITATTNKKENSKGQSLGDQGILEKFYDCDLNETIENETNTDTSIFENDEILQILFKKSFYYQSKLK